MKKIVLIIFMVFLLVGCSNKKEEIKDLEPILNIDELEVVEDEYVDENDTEIGLYIQDNNSFTLVKNYDVDILDGQDIGVFSIYPSNEESIIINDRYGINFYNKWTSNPNYDKLKIGFNIKFTLDTGEDISYNILDPETAIQSDKLFILAYLYDDYANRNSNWYSHIEQYEYSDESLFTAIKLYASIADDAIVSKIRLTVFTYDGLDDFDENNEYRGNSSYSIDICNIGKTC